MRQNRKLIHQRMCKRCLDIFYTFKKKCYICSECTLNTRKNYPSNELVIILTEKKSNSLFTRPTQGLMETIKEYKSRAIKEMLLI